MNLKDGHLTSKRPSLTRWKAAF